jgi:hypothetical protein
MKNDMKIILGAIIVILLLLVGAYALSGSSPQPTATPTVTPVTATPTPVPGGSTPSPSPSVAPSVVPSVTTEPTVTPTPVPESGVKLTEFGYWITYPPLGPQKWSTNPRPNLNVGDIVYFDHTSDIVHLNSITVDSSGEYAQVDLARSNASSTTNVIVYIDPASTLYFDRDQVSNNGGTVTFIDESHINIRFDEGVSIQHLQVWWLYEYAVNSQGKLILKIDEVDPGYSIGGNSVYTFSVLNDGEGLSTVQFATDEGYLGDEVGCTIEHYYPGNDQYNISFIVTRAGGDLSRAFTPEISIDETNIPEGYLTIMQIDPFKPGESTTKVYINYNFNFLRFNQVEAPYVEFIVDDAPYYITGDPEIFILYMDVNIPEY